MAIRAVDALQTTGVTLDYSYFPSKRPCPLASRPPAPLYFAYVPAGQTTPAVLKFYTLIQMLCLFFIYSITTHAGITHDRQVTSSMDTQLASTLRSRYGVGAGQHIIVVRIAAQRLYLFQDDRLIQEWPISSSEHGIGNREHSYQTPLGAHTIARKIGAGATPGTIFKGRENTHSLAPILTDQGRSAHDYVTTRILWLQGMEPGINQGPGIDSYQRFIYIHGTPEEGRIGAPASQGCIRMRNADVITLFDLVEPGTLVYIEE